MMKISIKREQSQAGLSFAEREKFRPQVKNKLLLLLALLLTAATGAWAANTVTWTAQNQLPTLEGKTTATIDGVTITTPSAITVSSGRATFNGATFSVTEGNITKIVLKSISGVSDYPTGWTISDYTEATWTGSAKSVSCGYSGGVYSIEFTIENVYTVTMAKGTVDATNWTINPAEAAEGTEVTIQYNGRLKVKGVTATSDAVAPSVPDGAISGVFSVSDSKQVYFSKGNLRYASSKWSFFDNQYDFYTSYSADAWDKFGWSTSATTYGMSTSSSNGDYSGDFVDWGATMGAGWRTLTSDEWAYLLKTRSASTVNGTENGRYAKAKVNNVPGIILFPDTYTHPAGVEAPTGVNATDEYDWEGNSYTAADWTKMESAGCVFLPAAGCRYGSEMIGLGSYGYYGSATPDGADYAYRVKFNSGSLEPANSINRCLGCSVRLVQEVAPNP